jgi:hypothetical protein
MAGSDANSAMAPTTTRICFRAVNFASCRDLAFSAGPA